MASKTIKGLFWSSIERLSVQGVQFLLSLFIARILQPSDYGLIAMLSIFMAIAQSFVDSGFSNALIQKQNRTEKDFSTVFYFNILVGLIMYLILFIASPLIAMFYKEPMLETIIKFVGLNLIINSLCAVQRAKLTISLNFKRQAIISFSSIVISGTLGIWMAYNNYGVWTLIWQSLLANFIGLVLLWISARWRPLFCFSSQSFKDLFGFGSKLLVGGLLHTVYMNLYSLIIGKYFSSSNLGNFNRASSIAQYLSINITSIITRVTYPVECQLQDNQEELQKKFFFFIRMTAFIIFPIMIGLCVLAQPLIHVILTEKWANAVPLLQILCLAYMWEPIMRMNWDLLNVKRRSDYSLKSEVIKKITAIIILAMSFPFGIKVMCVGLIIYSISDIFIVTQYTKRLLPDVSFAREVKELFPTLLLSLSMGSVSFLSTIFIESALLKITVGTIVGIIYYFSVSYILKWDEVKYIVFILKKKTQQ